MNDKVKTAVEIDNEKAADRACLTLIGMGYAWNGTEWVIPAPRAATAQPADRAVWRVTVETTRRCTFEFTPSHDYQEEESFRLSREACHVFERGPVPGEQWDVSRGSPYVVSRERLPAGSPSKK
jgi:hypothetical protein